jgi:hypothetical protein
MQVPTPCMISSLVSLWHSKRTYVCTEDLSVSLLLMQDLIAIVHNT